MSFASPVWLAALALIPAAIAVSIAARRRAKRYVIRFPAVSTLELAAAGGGPSWRRYVPIALVLAAIAALAFALARPQVSYSEAVRAASVVLVTDESGSMAATDVKPSRLAAAERAANTFIDRLPAQARVGAVAFSSAPNAVQAPTLNHSAARALIAFGVGQRLDRDRRGAPAGFVAPAPPARARQGRRRGDRARLRRGGQRRHQRDHRRAPGRGREDPDLHGRAGHAPRDAAEP